MESIGGVASLFAIISLAIQLGDSVIKTKRFLDTITHLPSEISRLRRLLDQSHAIADVVKTVLENNTRAQPENQHGPEYVYNSLAECLHIATHIEAIVVKSRNVQEGPTPLSRGRAQFRLACKKSHIETLENRFYGAVTVLNLTLSLHLV